MVSVLMLQTANIFLLCRSLLGSKKAHYWFGGDAVTKETLGSYLEAGKQDAHHLASWATETGKGLLFYGDSKDKPRGIFSLVR